MIKPQFEAGREKVGKKGIIRDINVHREVVEDINNFCNSIGLSIVGLSYSPIKGTEGNIEYLAHIIKDENVINIDNLINDIVLQSHEKL